MSTRRQGKTIKHGTRVGYAMEIALGLETCADCRRVEADRQKARNERMAKKNCSVRGCRNGQYCKTYCPKHYRRNRKYGDPLGGAPSPPLKPIEHGTRKGAQAELRRGLELCDACRQAKRRADLEWKREQYAPPPSEYAKRQLALRRRHRKALAALREEFREEYDLAWASQKRSRSALHLTYDGRRYRAGMTVAVKHPERFAELKEAA